MGFNRGPASDRGFQRHRAQPASAVRTCDQTSSALSSFPFQMLADATPKKKKEEDIFKCIYIVTKMVH